MEPGDTPLCWAPRAAKVCRWNCSSPASRAGWDRGADIQQPPRVLLVSVPYALKARRGDGWGNASVSIRACKSADGARAREPIRRRTGAATSVSIYLSHRYLAVLKPRLPRVPRSRGGRHHTRR